MKTRQLTWDVIQQLIARDDTLCLTLLMPTTATERPLADQTKLSHLLHQAETLLKARGFTTPAVAHFLSEAYSLTQSEAFWHYRRQGLALFVTNGFSRVYLVEDPLPECLILATQFYIKPLIPVVRRQREYCILSLNLHRADLSRFNPALQDWVPVRLMHGRGGVRGVPHHEELERQRPVHSFTSRTSAGFMTTHSHGAGEIDDKSAMVRYLQQVDASINQALHDSHLPLILKGVEELRTLYRQINTYPYLIEPAISPDPHHTDTSELRADVKPIIEQLCVDESAQALAHFRSIDQTRRETHQFEDIVREAREGRVETLLVAEDVEQWGTFKETTWQVELQAQPNIGNEPLSNQAAVNTLKNKGQVFVLPLSQMPHQALMAASLRY